MKIIDGNVTSAKGFSACGNHIGLKKAKKDLAMITSSIPCVSAGCFTTNVVKAAPVIWDMQNINNEISAVVINSGNANACTGTKGLEDAEETAKTMAGLMGVEAKNVLVCSTGVIGVNLPMQIVTEGIKASYELLSDTHLSGTLASEAIMTTDTYEKSVAVEIELGDKKVTLGGMAKGSGMISPNMATMLCFITTDCKINRQLLDKALKSCVIDTFNMISVDGDTSTNDTVIVMANGLAENTEITTENEDYNKFVEALQYINKTLAVACVNDGEGATKLMEVTTTGAKTKESARAISRSVVSSNLVKAALFGADANWGRVICAMGYSGEEFEPMNVTIVFRSNGGEITVLDKGTPVVFDEESASKILAEHNIYIDITLKEGNEFATAWGCDLTYDYVKINGDYRS